MSRDQAPPASHEEIPSHERSSALISTFENKKCAFPRRWGWLARIVYLTLARRKRTRTGGRYRRQRSNICNLYQLLSWVLLTIPILSISHSCSPSEVPTGRSHLVIVCILFQPHKFSDLALLSHLSVCRISAHSNTVWFLKRDWQDSHIFAGFT